MDYAVVDAPPEEFETGTVVEVLPFTDQVLEAVDYFKSKYKGQDMWLYEYEMVGNDDLDVSQLRLINKTIKLTLV